MCSIQSIFIKETETRQDPKSYIAYRIDIQAPVRQWQVWKRYSDFTKFHDQLTQTFPHHSLPAQLPHKKIFPPTLHSSDRIEERRQGLEAYLRTILCCRDDRWRTTDIWHDFLSIPASPTLSSPVESPLANPSLTIGSWLDEYDQLVNLTRDIRSLINNRTAHQNQQEVSDAMQCEVKAKKSLIALNKRLTNLENNLHETQPYQWMAEGEERRREDKLNKLMLERDVLTQLVNVTRQDFIRATMKKKSESFIKESRKEEGYGDIGFDYPITVKRAQTTSNSKPAHKIGNGRAFGSAFLKQQKQIQETELTKGLDNQELLSYQNNIMKDQDSHIEKFTEILSRQKELGFAINNELESQIQILESLDIQVDRTASKLSFANKKLSKIN